MPQQFSGSTPWPLPQAAQAEAIKTAIEHYGVLPQVFMGMYSNETNFGNFRNADGSIQTSTAGAVGPFQFTSPHKTPGLTYPMTSTPNFNEFIAQANAAAAYLKSLYNQLGHSWRNALAGYLVGGSGNLAAGMGYADKAMAAPIPASWSALIGSGPALPGGTAGAGGTGTLTNQKLLSLLLGKNQANFSVGDPANPDEDYWTAINRLAQERYWYLFSDGETLYLADGPDLMKQEPAARLDRIGNLDQINRLSYTWDNCLILATPIPTPTGWTTMGDIHAGDLVFGADGHPVRVMKVHPIHYDRDCYRVRLDDGTSIVADAGHLWETVACRRDSETTAEIAHQRYLGIRTTSQIATRLRLPHRRTGRNEEGFFYNHQIRPTAPLVLPEADLPIDPYVLGLWLGDEDSDGSVLTVGLDDRDEILTAITAAGYSYHVKERPPRGFGSKPSYRVALSLFPEYRQAVRHEDCLSRRLRNLGVFGNKHIPMTYLRASRSQRLALLQGIMDTDGSVTRDCALAFVSERLTQDSVALLRSLGFSVSNARRQREGRNGSLPLYSITFAARDDMSCFRLRRKAQAYATRTTTRRYFRTNRSIVAIERVPSVPVRCITVDSEDHLFVAGEGLTRTSNTAWRYSATHRKRKRAQRRTSLAKIVSPTEATLELICAIDEARAGDVIDFSNTGPGDGSWLVGDCRRSVFEILSEINLVPALTPLTEGALKPAGINTNNLSALLGGLGTGTGNYKGYVNPVGKWTPSRIDAGVDGTLVSDYLAPGDSHIMQADASNFGWAGGGAIGGRFLNGPLAGKVWYVTEGVAPLVTSGADVSAGTPVARRVASPYNGIVGNIETGWGQPGAATAPMGSGGDQSPNALAFGDSFNRFLRRVGAAPGHRSGTGVGVTAGPLPPGYP